jgi:hypothetical protein
MVKISSDDDTPRKNPEEVAKEEPQESRVGKQKFYSDSD